MGYNLRKTKTSRRVKRTNTNKRTTQKQRGSRKQTFRKNRRVNRGGNGTKRNREEEKHDAQRDMIDAEKDENNMKKLSENMEKKMYRKPLGEGLGPVITVNQAPRLEITEMQQRFSDDMDAEEEGEEGGIWFGGKKKRAISKK
jgi:hypothetical protein